MSNNEQIILVDADESSLHISWPAVPGARRYVLEMKSGAAGGGGEFERISDKLTQTEVRKRNLLLDDHHTSSSSPSPPYSFTFRVRARDEVDFINDDWVSHEHPFMILSNSSSTSQKRRLAPPKVTAVGGCAAVVQWERHNDFSSSITDGDDGDAINNKYYYDLQMREAKGGCDWKTIATSLKSNEVKKKNLVVGASYQFRVGISTSTTTTLMSSPSNTIVAIDISPGLSRLFGRVASTSGLLTVDDSAASKNNVKKTKFSDAIQGKSLILVYISAHWCGPCRQFTPQLAKFYEANRETIEIIFLSADHDEQSFLQYFGTMPWKAVGFDEDEREKLQAHFKVSSIPRLVVLNKDGKIVEDNAVGKPLDLTRWINNNK